MNQTHDKNFQKIQELKVFYFIVLFTLLSCDTLEIKTKQCICTFLTVKENDTLYESLTLQNYFCGIFPTHLNVYTFIFKKIRKINFYSIYLSITQLKEAWM